MSATPLFSSCYFAPISYFKKVIEAPNLSLEAFEYYQKQSYRNRARIFGANGVQDLIIPVSYQQKQPISTVKISNLESWQHQHWQSLISAYSNAPFFEYYEGFIATLYTQEVESLWEWNKECLKVILKCLNLKLSIEETLEFEERVEADYRFLVHPKYPKVELAPYYQVFAHKHGFQTDLSILDLLFNEGPQTVSYLH